MRAKAALTALLLSFVCLSSLAQVPLVYSAENTGAGCTAPPLPTFSQLPAIEPLPDPFMWADGRGRSTDFKDWECRRNEIKAEIENYEIGPKPNRPQTITASYTAGTGTGTGTLTVNVTVNGKTLTLTSQVSLPAGPGPFPAVIGMNSLSGSVPASVFTGRNVARIQFNHNQVTTYGNPQNTDPYYQLYPDLNINNTGQYSAWTWGVSRLIDGLELVQASLPIDLQHLGVTGCSYAGKMALFVGAFDERVALTIAQESGGGGAPAWRVSETLGGVEKLGNTDYNWFKEDMRQFAGLNNVSKLPHDHHELMAMVAPRALLVTGNTDVTWLANPSAYVAARAAHEVWKTFGAADRFGFYIDGGHGHCAVPAAQVPAMQAFVDKFLVGNTSVNTNITVNPYPQLDYQRWYQWWGTGNPVLPAEPLGKRIWLEAECGAVGSDWQTVADTAAANGKYVVVNGLQSTASAPGPTGLITFPFNVDSAATYNFVARVFCPTANDDSYWVKVDNGAFVTINGITTSTWEWAKLTDANLSVGPHTFTIGYREDGAMLDKVLITTSGSAITGKGAATDNCKTQQTISFAALPAALVGDADLTLAATASSGLPITYISSDTTVATVTNGVLRVRKAGTTVITAQQVGNATYAAVSASQVLTVAPLQLQVQYKDGDDSRPYGQIIKPTLRLDNLGAAAVAYSELTIRYWLTPENYSGLATNVDWAALGASNIRTRYVPLTQPHHDAFGYVEYTFDASLGHLMGGGSSGEIRSRFNNQAYGDLDENTDWSYRYNSWNYAPNEHITVYRNGRLVWGTEPEAITPIMALLVRSENRNGYSHGNTISTYLNVQNVGNVPVDYPALRVRYWFSPDGSDNINHWFDWAQVGTNNVGGVVGQQGNQLYFEVGFGLDLGQLYPLSSTGDVRFRLAKNDWTNFVEENDWSYRAPWNYDLNDHITLYYKGQLVFGAEPATGSAVARGAAPAAATATSTAASQGTLLEAYPNPAASATTVQFQAAQAGRALVQVYNPLGQLVATLYDGAVEDGRSYQLPLAAQRLANGLYECRLVLAGQTLVKRIAISH